MSVKQTLTDGEPVNGTTQHETSEPPDTTSVDPLSQDLKNRHSETTLSSGGDDDGCTTLAAVECSLSREEGESNGESASSLIVVAEL